MSQVVSVQPDAEVVTYPWGHTVYGWTSVLYHPTRRGPVRVRLFVSHHMFRWRANGARKRWLRENTPPGE